MGVLVRVNDVSLAHRTQVAVLGGVRSTLAGERVAFSAGPRVCREVEGCRPAREDAAAGREADACAVGVGAEGV